MLHAISLRGIFELCAGYNVVHFYLTGVKFCSTYVACGSFCEDHFLAQVSPSKPVFFAGPGVFIGERVFSFDCLLLGVRIVPGLAPESLGFKSGEFSQLCGCGLER